MLEFIGPQMDRHTAAAFIVLAHTRSHSFTQPQKNLVRLLPCNTHIRNVVIDGVIERLNFYTGWGMHNNIGGLLAMMIPFAFYLSIRYKRGWIGTLVGAAFLVGVVLTCSRGSILVASLIYFVCLVEMFYHTRNRKTNFIVLACVVGAVLLICILCRSFRR